MSGCCRRRGFTLIELLVVLGIILVLAGLLLPSIGKAYKSAQRTAMANDLQAIGTALEAFKQDHRDYPRVQGAPVAAKAGYDGAIVLCQALMGPGDLDDMDPTDDAQPDAQKNQLGFRVRPGGKLYPPYLAPERFQMKDPSKGAKDVAPTNGVPDDIDPANAAQFCFFDRFDKPILYFPASPAKPNVRVAATAGPQPYLDQSDLSRYDIRDNLGSSTAPGPFMRSTTDTANAVMRIHFMLGDRNANGYIDGDEQDIDLPFVLWSAGPDEVHGPNADSAGDRTALEAVDADKCDDVTNFR